MLNAIKVGLFGLGLTFTAALQATEAGVVENEAFAILYQKGEQGLADAESISTAFNLSISGAIPELGIFVFKGNQQGDVTRLVSNHPLVKSANDHHYVFPAHVPNDTFYNAEPKQGPLKQIKPEKAWDRGKGEGVVVAVLDTGIEYDHQDLSGNVLDGYDYIENKPIQSGSTDPNGHGTHIAGIIAALQDNNEGITGVAPMAKILPVRVLKSNKAAGHNGSGSSTVLTTIQGIRYAAKYAADNKKNVVINTSFGATSEQNYCAAINDALGLAEGRVVVVSAAMNGDIDIPHYPAACSGVIAVASVDAQDNKANYSNYGNWIHISAPGSSVFSTWKSDDYRYDSGTSMATGFVSGAIAVLLSANKEIKPSEIESYLTAANNVDQVKGSFAPMMGAGRLNLEKAMNALPVPPNPPTDPQITPPKPPGSLSIQIQ